MVLYVDNQMCIRGAPECDELLRIFFITAVRSYKLRMKFISYGTSIFYIQHTTDERSELLQEACQARLENSSWNSPQRYTRNSLRIALCFPHASLLSWTYTKQSQDPTVPGRHFADITQGLTCQVR